MCVNFTGCKTKQGYGLKRDPVLKKTRLAHHIAYENFWGYIPKHFVIMHLCDNPSCIDPTHLRLGTRGDNLKDAYDKGRFKNQHTKKTHCIHGHKLPEHKTGKQRRCLECRKVYG